ncbi:MAG: bifunctional diaminohydroxyphosphoribosylaminopyrimidine deaminase/5-amino-6-(5-phosphoribosylamino)uracil reductase RibD [Bacteroidetes bacterium]|nr:bifunctional diaminohydroxyphosphoribosylaminopyrimidine deaminase/5-amino-6-(5-phosphoribosylamino)uracil reductase RibD [Bacteroidota bacterium]
MKRCLDLARQGLRNVAPNPMVGAVLVHEDQGSDIILGEGFHEQYGSAHAERNAINAVSDKDFSLRSESTLYVNLEPCTHEGKQPPCIDLIIEYKIPKVIIGVEDPNPLVNLDGIRKLKENGVVVVTGVLEQECRSLNKRFYTFHEKKRPYIILKWAETKDGFIADSDNNSKWISSPESRKLVHRWRSEEMGIMVGTNTVVYDNPLLTVRDWNGMNPVRITIDKSGRIDPSSNIFNDEARTLIFVDVNASNKNDTIVIDFKKDTMGQILNSLYEEEIQSIIVEGGSLMLRSFIDAKIWDEARVFTTDKTFGNGIEAPEIDGVEIENDRIGKDVLKILIPKD